MRQYNDLLRHVLTYGRWSDNRTGIRTKKDFGYSMYFDLSQGEIPVVTTKYVHLPAVVHELIWFIGGHTNNEWLEANGVRIWREWALEEDLVEHRELHYNARVELLAQQRGITTDEAFDLMHKVSVMDGYSAAEEELDRAGIPDTETVVLMPKGSLGPVYGHQWRSWEVVGANPNDPQSTAQVIDQVANVIDELRTNPNSRRILISAWNVKDLPIERETRFLSYDERVALLAEKLGTTVEEQTERLDNLTANGGVGVVQMEELAKHGIPETVTESVSPQENVKRGKMALAPCHVMFQFGTLPMTTFERCQVLVDRFEERQANDPTLQLDDTIRAYYEYQVEQRVSEAEMIRYLDEQGIPKYYLNCHLYQRSADVFLGVPFNITSYALLTCMVAQVVGMVPGKFVHSFGDFHIYENHMPQVEEQQRRLPYPSPKIKLNRDVKELWDFKFEDIEFLDYQHHPAIKGKVAV